jgi:hypothetical protein
VPVAIKYNKVFVDAFWNSKQQTFAQHLLTLLTSWALVADVWYLVRAVAMDRACRGCSALGFTWHRLHACMSFTPSLDDHASCHRTRR